MGIFCKYNVLLGNLPIWKCCLQNVIHFVQPPIWNFLYKKDPRIDLQWGLFYLNSGSVGTCFLWHDWRHLVVLCQAIDMTFGARLVTKGSQKNIKHIKHSQYHGNTLHIHSVNTLRPKQNGRHFADDILKCIFVNENVWIPIKISLKFVPKGPINNIWALVQIKAWRRPGDKPLSEPMMISLPTHICVTRPQWVKRPGLVFQSWDQYPCSWFRWETKNASAKTFLLQSYKTPLTIYSKAFSSWCILMHQKVMLIKNSGYFCPVMKCHILCIQYTILLA